VAAALGIWAAVRLARRQGRRRYHTTVLTQIDVPIESVCAGAAADNLAVAFGRQYIHAQ